MSVTTDYSQFVWELEPFKGAGPLRLNQHIDHVREILGKERNITHHYKENRIGSYNFGGGSSTIVCDVNRGNLVTRLVFWKGQEVVYKGRHLFKEPQGRLTFWLAAEAQDNKELTAGLGGFYPTLGISTHFGNPHDESEAEVIEEEELGFIYEHPFRWVAIFLEGHG